MSYFEEKLSFDVVRKVAVRLEELDFRVVQKSDLTRQTEGIKDCVTSGVNETRILAENRFEVDLSPVDFSKAITKDYRDGLARVRSLSDVHSKILNQEYCSAWKVVTLYYVGFFSAVEILRAFGEYVSYFDSDSTLTITQCATVNAAQIESGSYFGVAKFHDSTGIVTISYCKSNVRHHQRAWSSIASLAQSSLKSRDKEEREIIDRIIAVLGQSKNGLRGVSPSDTRNHWNYEDPKLFGNLGSVTAENLVRLMRNPGAPLKWIRNKANLLDLSNATCALGFSSEFLRIVIEGLGDRIIPQ